MIPSKWVLAPFFPLHCLSKWTSSQRKVPPAFIHNCNCSSVDIAQICQPIYGAIFARYTSHARKVESRGCVVMHILRGNGIVVWWLMLELYAACIYIWCWWNNIILQFAIWRMHCKDNIAWHIDALPLTVFPWHELNADHICLKNEQISISLFHKES